MKMRTLLIMAGTLALVTPILGPMLLARQGSPAVKYDADCRITNYESSVVAEVVEGSAVYLLVDTVSDEGFYHQSVIVKDNAGCLQRSPVFVDAARPGTGLPKRVAVAFARANWQLAINNKGKEWVEHRLATSDIGGVLRSIEIYSEDIAAFDALGIRYPEYLRGLDEFESWQQARAYYDAVFKENPLPGCPVTQNHC